LTLLLTLARNAQHVFTRDQLLDLVWGKIATLHLQRSRPTSRICVSKLGDEGKSALIQTIRGVGYTLRLQER